MQGLSSLDGSNQRGAVGIVCMGCSVRLWLVVILLVLVAGADKLTVRRFDISVVFHPHPFFVALLYAKACHGLVSSRTHTALWKTDAAPAAELPNRRNRACGLPGLPSLAVPALDHPCLSLLQNVRGRQLCLLCCLLAGVLLHVLKLLRLCVGGCDSTPAVVRKIDA